MSIPCTLKSKRGTLCMCGAGSAGPTRFLREQGHSEVPCSGTVAAAQPRGETRPGRAKAPERLGHAPQRTCVAVPRTSESGEGNQKRHSPLREETTDRLQPAVQSLGQRDGRAVLHRDLIVTRRQT